jgi:hypothetical protein
MIASDAVHVIVPGGFPLVRKPCRINADAGFVIADSAKRAARRSSHLVRERGNSRAIALPKMMRRGISHCLLQMRDNWRLPNLS